jgi:PhnB protein
MPHHVKRIPEGLHTITPHMIVRNATQAIDFYKKAFGAEELHRAPGPDGKTIMHADLKIGTSHVFLCDEFPQMGAKSPQSLGGTPITLALYVEDADKAFNQAVKAGAEVVMPLKDQFWGDRYGMLKDPYGHTWSISSHMEDVPPAEMQKRAAEAFKAGGACGQK